MPPVRIDPRGKAGPTKRQASGRYWRRTSQGFYVPSDVDGRVPEQRIAEASALIPAVGGLTGWAALRWCGATWFDGLRDGGRTESPVVLATGYCDVRNQPGVVISQERLSLDDLTVYDGLPVTEPARSLWFEVRYAPSLVDAVIAIDMAAFADLVAIREYAKIAHLRRGWTGAPRARHAIGLADENSWSPAETRLRLLWTLDAGLPPPICNVPIFDRRGRHIGTPDLFDPDRGIAVEYDGRLHLQGHQRSKDATRIEQFHRHGISTVTALANDVTERDRLIGRFVSAFAQSPPRHPDECEWTIRPPSWWRPTLTVTQRRALARAGMTHFLPRTRAA